MAMKFEQLRVLQAAETIANGIWNEVIQWDPFVRDIVGNQLTSAADSVGASIAESFGRFHYGEKNQFCYYARRSIFETKYWLNLSIERELLPPSQGQDYASQLSELARQLNTFIAHLKTQHRDSKRKMKNVSETATRYLDDQLINTSIILFSEEEINWINKIPNIQ
jgi:four helix bundle protein